MFASLALVDDAGQPVIAVVSYGPNYIAEFRHSGTYIDAILKGSKPGDLPVEGPTVFDLAVNLKTAKAIGLAIPASVLAQATMVVEEDGSVH